MKPSWLLTSVVVLACGSAQADMRVESFSSPPTPAELASFEAEVLALSPGAGGNLMPANDWAQHASGQRTRAMGLFYELTHDRDVLDHMLGFCDVLLASRNDLAAAPLGQQVLWTGEIEPAWPNRNVPPISTAGEQGDAIGHLGYCARLVLATPALADATVPDGDPFDHGATYLARARHFVGEADHALDQHVLAELIDLSDRGRMYWAVGNPGHTGSVPWNQQFMFAYALQNLAEAHRLLADDPQRALRYDAIVQAMCDWFFSGEPGTATPYLDGKGRTAYLWAYRPPTGVEDWSHSNLDIQGLYRAHAAGLYGLGEAEMVPLANTFLDVIWRGPDDYAGRVDGTDGGGNSAPTSYVRPGWYLAALFRPADHLAIVSADLAEGGETRDVTRFAYFLWVKCKLHPEACQLPAEPAPEPDAGVPAEVDAGVATGDDAGPPRASDETAGCACHVGSRGEPARAWAWLLLAAWASRRGRRSIGG